MMAEREFIYTGHPARVIFGFGTTARLPEELARLGKQRALVLATPAQKAEAESLLALLGPAGAGIFAGAVMHTPSMSASLPRNRQTRFRRMSSLPSAAVRPSGSPRQSPCAPICPRSSCRPPMPVPK